MIIGLCLGFSACSDDDKDDVVSAGTLVGTWESSWSTGYIKYVNNPKESNSWDESVSGEVRIKINADGTGISTEDEENFSFKWKLDGNKLSIDSEDEQSAAIVLIINNTEMVLEMYEVDEKYEYYEKTTYRRVK